MLAVSKNFSFLNFSSLSAMGLLLAAVPLILRPAVAHADGVQTYGTEDALGTGAYGTDDPTAGATKIGLAPNVSSLATKSYAHTFPFTPSPGDFPGTDQIYVGSVQTASDDGYSSSPDRISGPDVITMDYSSLVPADSTIQTVTLGIAADNFEFPVFGQPFNITLNGASAPALTSLLESLDQSGPIVQYVTLGISPSTLGPSNVLTLSIDEGGNGGDGWAVDFTTVGVTTTAVPEPATLSLVLLAAPAVLARRRGRTKGDADH